MKAITIKQPWASLIVRYKWEYYKNSTVYI